MEYVRCIWFVFNCIFHVIFAGIPCYIIILCMKPCIQKETLHNCISYLGSLYFKICIWASGLKIHIYGLENIDKQQHYIYMSNHTSNFDVPIFYSTLFPYDIISVYRGSLVQQYPIFGWFLHNSANIPIDKTNTKSSIENMNNLATKLCKKKKSVIIFPEGKIADTEEMISFKTGGSILAIKTGIPILPLAICGCKNIFANCKINQAPIKIFIGKPIPTSDLNFETDKHALTQKVFDCITELKKTNTTTKPHIVSMSFVDCFIPICV